MKKEIKYVGLVMLCTWLCLPAFGMQAALNIENNAVQVHKNQPVPQQVHNAGSRTIPLSRCLCAGAVILMIGAIAYLASPDDSPPPVDHLPIYFNQTEFLPIAQSINSSLDARK